MSDFLRRHVVFILWLALFVFSAQLTAESADNPEIARVGGRIIVFLLAPGERMYHKMLQGSRSMWSRYVWLLGVESERDELQLQVKELEARNSRLVEYKIENERLRKLLDFRDRMGFREVVAGDVIGRDASNWTRTITIDRGSADGLRSGMPVVDGNAVVGQTTVVSKHSSRVLLLTDSSSAIDAIVQSSRAAGILEGQLGVDTLRLRYVLRLKEYAVKPGDRVICSGLDGVFPKGALIGVVNKVDQGSSGLFQDIEVIPSVDVRRLESVLVLTSKREEMEGAQFSADFSQETAQKGDAASSVPAEAPGRTGG